MPYVTPTNVVSIVIAPDVDVAIAGDDELPPPTVALPLLTVYVHVMPSTVAVVARSDIARPVTTSAVKY